MKKEVETIKQHTEMIKEQIVKVFQQKEDRSECLLLNF
jgi:hypothetical protein